ncbi:MAG TPA: 50S ribosomal protein L16 [Candidatus Aerophobetes bacterium]|uniref:Large ribosomal subunit protein uL16 n=1 Tax=Aerophobetes bacterium TaxID=2030807 RepID=A0A7C1M7E8_UNCAE|nr:50S ribosomal protein L16 [Candidatus Aerophobetes bacterium]
MRLQPKRVNYRKVQRGKLRGRAQRGTKLNFGQYGLMAEETKLVTASQIEATRVTIVRSVGHEGRLWIRIFPDKPITRKPLETRMGKGKGEPDHWVAPVKAGRIMFELGGIGKERATAAFRLASRKLPLKTRIVFPELWRQL